MGIRTVSLLGMLSLFVVANAMAADVTTCDPLPAGETGVLPGPLSCAAAIQLGNSATLDLNGFVLSGGVRCDGRKCSIISGAGVGTILGGGIVGERVILNNVDVDCDGASYGIAMSRLLDASDVTVKNCTGFGIHYGGDRGARVKAHGLDVINNGVGMELNMGALVGTDINVSGNASAGVYSGKIKGEGFTATGNGTFGLSAARTIKVSGASVSGNGTGVFVTFGSARLKDSAVSGNGVDVATARRPRLNGVNCATSRKVVSAQITPESWLVCAGE